MSQHFIIGVELTVRKYPPLFNDFASLYWVSSPFSSLLRSSFTSSAPTKLSFPPSAVPQITAQAADGWHMTMTPACSPLLEVSMCCYKWPALILTANRLRLCPDPGWSLPEIGQSCVWQGVRVSFEEIFDKKRTDFALKCDMCLVVSTLQCVNLCPATSNLQCHPHPGL